MGQNTEIKDVLKAKEEVIQKLPNGIRKDSLLKDIENKKNKIVVK